MTYTHLTVGQSRIPAKPPRGKPPCTEAPAETTSNALTDPGFELQLSNFSGGPEGSEIPGVSLGNGVPYIWVGGTDAGLRTHWTQFYRTASFVGTDRYWQVSTANPRTGTYHARVAMGSTGPNNLWGSLMCGQYTQCNWVGPTASTPQDFYTATVEPGMFVRASAYMTASTAADVPQIEMWVQGYDTAFASTGLYFSTTPTLTTSYVAYETSSFVPAGTAYVLLGFNPETNQTVETQLDVDDVVLEVS